MLVLSVSASQAQERSDHKSLPNFHQVNDKLYRGAQPKTGGLRELAKLGIKTIVNLSGKGEGVAEEEAQTRNQGLRYLNVPLKRSGRPHDADIERILSIINSPEYQPVFVHCKGRRRSHRDGHCGLPNCARRLDGPGSPDRGRTLRYA